MQIEIQLTSPDWRTREVPGGTLHWRGYPDDVDALAEGLARALAGHGDQALERVAGHWCGVLESSQGVVVSQDPLRSWPLFFATTTVGHTGVTDDIEAARAFAGNPPLDEEAALEFSHLGFVTGSETLFVGVQQFQAGEWIAFLSDGSRRSDIRSIPKHDHPGLASDSDLDVIFSRALEATFDRLFDRIGDRQVVIPLSGGLDSRLLAIAMSDRGHKNVVNFTYGVGRTNEVNISEEVATRLGQRWEFISYTREEIRSAWASPAASAFIRESYAGASLPHIQDWYPVSQLQARNLINEDAVFLPGHTIVGNMHNEEILSDRTPVSSTKLTSVLLDHHATLQPAHVALLQSRNFTHKLETFFARIGYDGSPAARLDALEYWNILERQTKYINHSVRGYEHFGYEWALPMLDRELLDAWGRFGVQAAQDRSWYRRYVNARYSNATGTSLSTFEAFAAANVSQTSRDRVKSVLRALGLLHRVERRVTARAFAQHPMGFQEFIGETTPRELHEYIMRGGHPMGIYAHRFLEDTWNPHTDIFGKGPVS